MILEKYHGCGNDFLITFDEGLDYQNITPKLCNRGIGIGADGLIVASLNPFKMMLYNQDGTIANMCGNGIRCLAYYFVRHNYVTNNTFNIETLDGNKEIEVISKEPFICKVNMGSYSLDKDKMGFTKENMNDYVIEHENKLYHTSSCFLGTYHTIVYMPKVSYGLYPNLGKKIMEDNAFKNQTNVDFVEIVSHNELKVNTYERGVGFTYACGTGSCASFVISYLKGICSNPVKVTLPYGELVISKEGNYIYMEGPANYVGKIEI